MVCEYVQRSFGRLINMSRYLGSSLALLPFSGVYRVRFLSRAPPYPRDDPQHLSDHPTRLVTTAPVAATNMDLGSGYTRGPQEG